MTTTSSMTAKKTRKQHRFFRKALVLPAEHGSWSWLLVPFLVGVAVAAVLGSGSLLNLALLLTLTGGLSAFLMRQPATAWLRIRQGRGRRRDGPVAAGWTMGFAMVSLLSLLGLLLLERSALLWLLPPLAVILVAYLAVARIHRAGVRSLWMEAAGAAGLAAMAPAAYVAASGGLDHQVWLLWILMASQNILGVLYVRQRLADTHQRAGSRGLLLAGHLLGLGVLTLLSFLAGLPWPALLPFVGFLLRAIWAIARHRPVTNIKRFGFTEVGVELLSGFWIVVAYLLV